MKRDRGAVMILVIILGLAFMMLSMISVQMSLSQSDVQDTQEASFYAREIAESGAAHALVRIRDGGLVSPSSGTGVTPTWVTFDRGQFYYRTSFDSTTNTSTIRAWGRVAAGPSPSTCSLAPDATDWNGTDWMLQGMEISVKSRRYIPETPMYMGNGGLEKPLGGFAWANGVDPTKPSTWIPITSGPSSYQSSSVPFEISALDYPIDYIYNGGTPTPASTNPHPYKIWTSQNLVGQYNTMAWFTKSAGAGVDPTIKVTPAPTGANFNVTDTNSSDYPYPVNPSVPDVQDFAFNLWSTHKDDAAAIKLAQGAHSGEYGTLANPKITFVTGELQVAASQSFRGCGILVIRDNYDPNTQTSNTPTTSAKLTINGNFEWTGLVMVAGWSPSIAVTSTVGAQATIVGAMFGEDSVQSGGEVSLNSASIVMTLANPFRLLYSNTLFRDGGLLNQYLPLVRKEIVGIRDI